MDRRLVTSSDGNKYEYPINCERKEWNSRPNVVAQGKEGSSATSHLVTMVFRADGVFVATGWVFRVSMPLPKPLMGSGRCP